MLEVFESLDDTEVEISSLPREYDIDFDTMTLSGEIVEGAEALAIWSFFALKTARYRYRAYTWQYGNEIESIIGKGYGIDYTKSEIERFISDCVCCHPYISGIEDTEMSFSDEGRLTVSFKLVTAFGDKNLTIQTEGV